VLVASIWRSSASSPPDRWRRRHSSGSRAPLRIRAKESTGRALAWDAWRLSPGADCLERIVPGATVCMARLSQTPDLITTGGGRGASAPPFPCATLHNAAAHGGNPWLRQWRRPCPSGLLRHRFFHRPWSRLLSLYAVPESWPCGPLAAFGFHGLNQAATSASGDAQHGHHHPSGLSASVCTWRRPLAAIRDGRSTTPRWANKPFRRLVRPVDSGSVDRGLRSQHSARPTSRIEAQPSRRRVGSGLSGLSGDMRQLREAAQTNHAGALAPWMFSCNRLLQANRRDGASWAVFE